MVLLFLVAQLGPSQPRAMLVMHGAWMFFRTGSDGIFRRFAILPGNLDMIPVTLILSTAFLLGVWDVIT